MYCHKVTAKTNFALQRAQKIPKFNLSIDSFFGRIFRAWNSTLFSAWNDRGSSASHLIAHLLNRTKFLTTGVSPVPAPQQATRPAIQRQRKPGAKRGFRGILSYLFSRLSHATEVLCKLRTRSKCGESVHRTQKVPGQHEKDQPVAMETVHLLALANQVESDAGNECDGT